MSGGTAREFARFQGSHAVIFNEDSQDIDFRVESNGNTHMLFVDGGNDHVNIGTATDLGATLNVSGTGHFETTGNETTLTLKSTDADASSGPRLLLNRESSSPADGDDLGKIFFFGKNDNAEDQGYAEILAEISDASDGTEDGRLVFNMRQAGATTEAIRCEGSNGVVVNEGSADVDFRVESNGLTHALFVDAGNDIVRVGLGSGGDVATSGFQVGDTKNNVFAAHIFHTGDNSSAAPKGLQITYTASSPDTSTSAFFRCNDSTTDRMFITSEGDIKNHDNSYGSTSDERIKQDIRDSNSQWDDIKNIKIRNYKKKDDVRQYGDKAWEQIGVIAQELETVSPKLIRHNDPSASDILSDSSFGTIYADGDSIPEDKKIGDVKEIKEQVKSVSYSVLYMKAIKALQEAMTRIETLEAEVTALKE
jgi:hypothetical protein